MEFGFSKEEELLQWAVGDFARRELASREELTALGFVPPDIIRKIGELGFMGLRIPERYGGQPATWVMLGILAEEIAKANIAIAYLIMLSYEISLSLALYGTDEAKEEWLCTLAKGDKLGCISVTEADSGSDVTAIKTRAIRDRHGYLISGEKSPISFGNQADLTMLFAKTNLEAGPKGVTAFLVPLDLPGITKSPITHMGLSPSAPASFRINEVRVPLKYRIGEEGEGFHINTSMGLFSDFSRVLSGLISLGLSHTALNLAISYAKERVAFGRPIGTFQAISGKIAEDATLIEAGRWLCYRTLWLKDRGLPSTKEAAMCGWWCPKAAFQVIEDSLLIHGHAGYSEDHPFQQMLRDVTAFEIIAGMEQVLKLIIAQKVVGRLTIPDKMSGEIS